MVKPRKIGDSRNSIREEPGQESESEKEKTMTVMDLEKTPSDSDVVQADSREASAEKTQSDLIFDT